MQGVFILIASIFFFFLLRATLIVLGYYKEPILKAFQNYGEEIPFSPLLDIVIWGLMFFYLIFLIVLPSSFIIALGILSALIGGQIYYRVKEKVFNHPDVFMQYPHWYRDLVDRTSREERRRLAYMWLSLPIRTRMLYNTRDDAFQHWADLVVISGA